MTEVVMVVAVAANGVIGGDNRLLWRLKSDMVHFRALTMGKPMIMGRKTFESIGRPLPGRRTIVVTRHPERLPDTVLTAPTPVAALELARREAAAMGTNEVIVAGGGKIYAALLALADRLEITEVALEPAGDVHFPTIPAGEWRETRRQPQVRGPEDEAAFSFVTHQRANGSAP